MDLLNEAIFLGIGHEHDSVRSFANGGRVPSISATSTIITSEVTVRKSEHGVR